MKHSVFNRVALMSFVWANTLVVFVNGQPPLQYDIEVGAKFGYRVAIEATYDDFHYQYGGLIDYEVLDNDADSIKLKFRGGLEHKTEEIPLQAKPGKIAIRLPKFVQADSPEHFPALRFQQLEFQLSKQGEVALDAGEDDSPATLPFFIGDLRTLVFQPLSGGKDARWHLTRPATTVSEEMAEQKVAFANPRFDRQKATEKLSYSSGRRNRTTVPITKEWALQSANGKIPFVGMGKGQWQLETRKGIPLRLQEQRELRVQRASKFVVARVMIKIQLADPHEITSTRNQMAIKQQEKAAAIQRKVAKQNKLAGQPLSVVEQRQILNVLNGDSRFEIRKVFIELCHRPLAKDQPAVVQAVQQFASKNRTEFAAQINILEAYWKLDLDGKP